MASRTSGLCTLYLGCLVALAPRDALARCREASLETDLLRADIAFEGRVLEQRSLWPTWLEEGSAARAGYEGPTQRLRVQVLRSWRGVSAPRVTVWVLQSAPSLSAEPLRVGGEYTVAADRVSAEALPAWRRRLGPEVLEGDALLFRGHCAPGPYPGFPLRSAPLRGLPPARSWQCASCSAVRAGPLGARDLWSALVAAAVPGAWAARRRRRRARAQGASGSSRTRTR